MSLADGHFAKTFLRMRTPLARVELAASRLARFAESPAARDLAAGITEAVQVLDDEIDRSLRVLGMTTAREVDRGDCRAILPALRRRMQPVLRAHGIEWIDGWESAVPVSGDRLGVGRAALGMLRAAMVAARGGAHLRVELTQRAGDSVLGVRVRLDRLASSRDAAFADARELASAMGGSLEVQPDGSGVSAVLWLEASA